MNLLEKYSKKNLPHGHPPTTEEFDFAILHPHEAEQWVKDYLDAMPNYKNWREFRLRLAGPLK